MHEMSLAEDVIDILKEQLENVDLELVRIVRVAVGEMMMVEKNTFIFAYDAIKEDTPLKNSSMELIEVPLKALCQSCGCRFSPEKLFPRCTQCGSDDYVIEQGKDMYVQEVEIEESQSV